MATILIDSQIWALALKHALASGDHPQLPQMTAAREVVASLGRDRILVTAQVLAEVYHTMAFRGRLRLSPVDAEVVSEINALGFAA